MSSGFVNKIEYATYKMDADLKIVQIDEIFTKMTGYTPEDIRQREIHQADLIFEEDMEKYFSMVQESLEKSGEAFIEHRIRCKDGTEKYVFCLGQDTVDKNGVKMPVIRVMDVTHLIYMRLQAEKIRKENDIEVEEWMKIANTDELTGVLRRGAFLPTINELVREGVPYTLLIIDVDDFKNVNDICGHPVGDKVLQAIASTFKAVVREKDLICRIGGDEFSIFLNKIDSARIARGIAERIISEVSKLRYITEEKVPIHVSIGGVVHNSDSKADLKDVFREADEALYVAKENGKNQCVIR